MAVFAPAGTLTASATIALELDELRETLTPPDPAFVERVTVPEAVVPPVRTVGAKRSPTTVAG